MAIAAAIPAALSGLFSTWGVKAAKKIAQRLIDSDGSEGEIRKAEIGLMAIDAQAAVGQRSARPFLQYVAGAIFITYLAVTIFGLFWNAIFPESFTVDWKVLYTDAWPLLGWAITYTTGSAGLREWGKRHGTADNPSVAGPLAEARKSRVQSSPGQIETRPEIKRALDERRSRAKPPMGFSGFQFSRRSLSNRAELDEPMQRVADRGLSYSPYDWVMIEAGRTLAEQQLHVANGDSKTLDSRHIEEPAQAFDIMVLDENGKGTWQVEPYYRAVTDAMKRAADDEGVGITCGYDWGWDSGHFERDRAEVPFSRPPDIALS